MSISNEQLTAQKIYLTPGNMIELTGPIRNIIVVNETAQEDITQEIGLGKKIDEIFYCPPDCYRFVEQQDTAFQFSKVYSVNLSNENYELNAIINNGERDLEFYASIPGSCYTTGFNETIYK